MQWCDRTSVSEHYGNAKKGARKLEDLSPNEVKIFEFIKAYILINKHPPSFREISKGTKIRSMRNVFDAVTVLRKREFIESKPSQPRTTKIIRSRKELLNP